MSVASLACWVKTNICSWWRTLRLQVDWTASWPDEVSPLVDPEWLWFLKNPEDPRFWSSERLWGFVGLNLRPVRQRGAGGKDSPSARRSSVTAAHTASLTASLWPQEQNCSTSDVPADRRVVCWMESCLLNLPDLRIDSSNDGQRGEGEVRKSLVDPAAAAIVPGAASLSLMLSSFLSRVRFICSLSCDVIVTSAFLLFIILLQMPFDSAWNIPSYSEQFSG